MLPDGSWGPTGPVDGTRCAFMAPIMLPSTFIFLIEQLAGEYNKGYGEWIGAQLVGFSGLVNLLLPFYLFTPLRLRNKIALVIAVCLAVTVPGIELSNMLPLPACYVWIGSVLLILTPQLLPSSYEYTVPPRPKEPDFAANRFLVPNDVHDSHIPH